SSETVKTMGTAAVDDGTARAASSKDLLNAAADLRPLIDATSKDCLDPSGVDAGCVGQPVNNQCAVVYRRRRKDDRNGCKVAAPGHRFPGSRAMSEWMNPSLSRRACLSMLGATVAAWSTTARAQASQASFEQWVAAFRARARARGIPDATYTWVMGNIKPDTAVFELDRYQPEFNEQLWQYLNRRVSDWRITTGKEKSKEYAPLFARIEKDYGVDRGIMLGLWGIESAFGDPDVQKNHMRPVVPALAALAWGEPRRRAYWEQELLNALVIIERGWSTPEEMR